MMARRRLERDRTLLSRPDLYLPIRGPHSPCADSSGPAKGRTAGEFLIATSEAVACDPVDCSSHYTVRNVHGLHDRETDSQPGVARTECFTGGPGSQAALRHAQSKREAPADPAGRGARLWRCGVRFGSVSGEPGRERSEIQGA